MVRSSLCLECLELQHFVAIFSVKILRDNRRKYLSYVDPMRSIKYIFNVLDVTVLDESQILGSAMYRSCLQQARLQSVWVGGARVTTGALAGRPAGRSAETSEPALGDWRPQWLGLLSLLGHILLCCLHIVNQSIFVMQGHERLLGETQDS